MRHAETLNGNGSIEDIERPLVNDGVLNTNKITSFLKENNVFPDYIISSPAVRAHETSKIIAQNLNYSIEKIIKEKMIYFGNVSSYFDIIYSISSSKSNVFLVGHNPIITQLANEFLSDKIDNMPTSCIVGLSFDVENWTEINKIKSNKLFVISPKMLKN